MFKYQIEAKTNYLSLGLIFATIAWLTKWEGQLLFFSVILFSLFKLNILKKKDLKLFLHVLIIPVCILLIWVTGRSIVYKDFSNVLSVSNSNSEQFFYKLYTVIPSELYSLNKDLSFENSKNERENLIFDNQKQIQVIIPDNGPYSQKLYDHVNNFIFKNPKSFEALKKPLDEAYQNSEKKIDLYYELFEKFGVDYNSLTNNIFSQPNIYYFNYISNHLDNFIGKDEKDKLFRKSMFESVKNNPNILLIFIFDFFKSYGIDLKNFFKNGKNFYGERLSGTFINPFNAGNCAKSNLTDKAFSEYEISHVNWHNGKKKIDNLVNRIVIYMDFVNDFIVAYLGPLFIVGTIILIFFDYKLFIPLAIFPFSYDFLVAITVDANVNSKYEVITFSLKYILLALFFSLLINLFKKNRYGKK